LSLESTTTASRSRMFRERSPRTGTQSTPPLSGFDRARLRQSPLLATLPGEAFDRLLPEIHVLAVGRDMPVFHQGEPADALHILLEGRVALLGSTPDNRACILEILGPIEGLLDPSALIGGLHPVSARTIEACRIVWLPEAAVRHLVDAEQGLCRGAVTLLSQQWRLFLRRLEDQKLRSAPQRLAAYLAECAQASQPKDAAPIRFILAEDRRTLASHLGMTPENLSRVIGQLRQHGVELNGRAVTITDLAGLRHFGCAAAES
jgi:CRP-like cAMP-binding protein